MAMLAMARNYTHLESVLTHFTSLCLRVLCARLLPGCGVHQTSHDSCRYTLCTSAQRLFGPAVKYALRVLGMRIRSLLRALRERGASVENLCSKSTQTPQNQQRWQTQPSCADTVTSQRSFGQAVGATHPWVRRSSSLYLSGAYSSMAPGGHNHSTLHLT